MQSQRLFIANAHARTAHAPHAPAKAPWHPCAHAAESWGEGVKGKHNPRQTNGRARKRMAARYAAMDAPCALCKGARGPICYDQPRSHLFPLSLVIDEIKPVSRWREFGYASKEDCARDPDNWQPAHWICNAQASDKRKARRKTIKSDQISGTF